LSRIEAASFDEEEHDLGSVNLAEFTADYRVAGAGDEIVAAGQNGVLIPVRNTSALLEAMLELMTNSIKRKQLATAARRIIVEKFSREIIWEALLSEYKSFAEPIIVQK